MDDKRIKLITKEMFIAWGMICMGFIIVDSIWHIFGITPFYTCQPALQGVGAVAHKIIFFSNFLSVIIVALFVDYTKQLGVRFVMPFWYVLTITFQFFIYWYLGNIIGRLIVWKKHFRKKSTLKPEPDK